MEAKALIDTVADRLAKMEMQTRGVTLVEVEAKVLVDTLGDKIAEEVDTLCEAVAEVEAEVLVKKWLPG